MAPTQLPGIRRENAGVEARAPGAGQERDRQLVVVGHVQLVEAGGLAVGFSDGFDGRGAGRGQAVGEIELLGDLGDGDFAGWIVDLVDAYRGETDWCGD